MNNNSDFIKFAEDLFTLYFKEHNLSGFLDMLDENVTWYGLDSRALCLNKEAIRCMIYDERYDASSLSIVNQHFAAFPVKKDICVVIGDVTLKDIAYKAMSFEQQIRTTFLCQRDAKTNAISLLHAHSSVPLPDKVPENFSAEVISKSYNDMLKLALEERTRSLRETTIELQTVISNIKGGVQVCENNRDFTNIYANASYYNMCGYTREEFKEKFNDKHIKLIHPDYREPIANMFIKTCSTGDDITVEYPIVHKNGELVWVLDKGSLLEDDTGKKRYQCVLTDITDLHNSLNAIEQLKDYYQSILNSLPNPIIIKDKDSKLSFVNHAAISAMGIKCDPASLIGKECRTLSLDICGTDACPMNMLKHGNNVTRYSHNHRDYSITTVPLISKGENIGFVESLQDETIQIMNRKMLMQKNEELMVADARHKIAMEQVNIYMFEYIITTKQLILSDNAVAKFGMPKTFNDVPHGIIFALQLNKEMQAEITNAFDRINDGEQCVRSNVVLRDKLGVDTMQEITMTSVYNNMGDPIRAIGIMMDITERGELQTQRQYREAITADNYMTYEVNISKDKMIDYNQRWKDVMGHVADQPYTKVLQYAAKKYVYADDRKRYLKFCSPSNMIASFKKGTTSMMFEYRRLNAEGEYLWVESTFSIIRDSNTSEVKMLCQIKDITITKEQALRAQDEQMYYEAMISTSATVYEINLTKNVFVKGHENWAENFGITEDGSYSDMIEVFSEKIVLPEDREKFLRGFRYSYVMDTYESGGREIYCEYRRPASKDSEYIWVSSTMKLIDDPVTGEIKAFSRVEDINEKKLWELELLYSSQRDYISGMFNKGTAQRLIEDFVLSEEGKTGKHAFIMFDIDNFKNINDNFGHLFGDAVLSEVSRKATGIFRDNDMLGRIGGDEFAILMKNIPVDDLAIDKAKELCQAVEETYTTGGKKYPVSISVGIAIFSEDGKSYDELYQSADKALYFSKKAGKNTVTRFNSQTMNDIVGVNPANIKARDIESMSVERNMGEYVFRILHDAVDKTNAIETVLELVGKHYKFERAHIFEDSIDGLVSHCTFQWCADGISPFESESNILRYDELPTYKDRFDKFGVLVLEEVDSLTGKSAEISKQQKLKSFVHFSMVKDGRFMGFIGFNKCNENRSFGINEINELKSIADVISVFLFDLRAKEKQAISDNASMLLLERLCCSTFIVDIDTHKIKDVNHVAKTIGTTTEECCHKQFYNLDAPCVDCKINNIKSGEITEYFTSVIGYDGAGYNVQTIPVEWHEGDCCMIIATRNGNK